MASANSNWTSVTDIGANSSLSPTPSGSGTAEMLEYALDFAVDDYERISLGYGDQASAMSEGRRNVEKTVRAPRCADDRVRSDLRGHDRSPLGE